MARFQSTPGKLIIHNSRAMAPQSLESLEQDPIMPPEGLPLSEPQAKSREESGEKTAPTVDFKTDSEIVRVVAEGVRLGYAHLFNPAFATEISMIDPLPHQRIAVYDYMLPQPRLRFLLGDEPGAGKTIMAGLYIREMLARRLLRRVLIAPPAGLVGNWYRELKTLFGLDFRVVVGAGAKSSNPFTGAGSDLIIISVDTLASERPFARLQEPAVEHYDLCIFDECHKLAADRQPDFTIRKTDRYPVAEALAGVQVGDPRWALEWAATHLLLLTATPHMGKDFPYYALWRLLEPEVLSTVDAFNAYPADARRRHFVRRTKEEMVSFDGKRIYPSRVSDTLSYDLSQGEISEQTLYDRTTDYIDHYYNRARILNRSAARFAMSVFQRRLASSTYALLRSFERRLEKLDGLIESIKSGKITADELASMQRDLDDVEDVFEEETGDEETPKNGEEENEIAEGKALGGVVAVSLAELIVEREHVQSLLNLATHVDAKGDESKFDKLREDLNNPESRDEKRIIFTEHRDTLVYLVRRLEGLGFTGQIARIHGGMDFREREVQIEFFRKHTNEGGALYMVCTDAAGEGLNMQFAWRLLNWDIPWNPARLEQRMGRIHRYKQMHDPVYIINLVAGKTRVGRVMKTLLEKIERIRKELGNDKVFDVIGRLFEGVSIKQYMEKAVASEGAAEHVCRVLEGTMTREQVEALESRERKLYGDGGDVKSGLANERERLDRESWRRLLPGYVRRFIEKSAPLLGLGIDGDLDGTFAFTAQKAGALDFLWNLLETYPPVLRQRLTVLKPKGSSEALFLHPGEPVFDRLRNHVCERFAAAAQRGAVFVDPLATSPYLFLLAAVSVSRRADPAFPSLARTEVLDHRLVGLRQYEDGIIESSPVEHLLLLKGRSGIPAAAAWFASRASDLLASASDFAREKVAMLIAEDRRRERLESLPARLEFVQRGYDYQDSELAQARSKLREKAQAGDPRAKAEFTKIKDRQKALAARRENALAVLRREPELIEANEIVFLAHALVVPTDNPEDKKRFDAEVEAIAIKVAWAFEEAAGAVVTDVSKPRLARAAGLEDNPGFDLLSNRPGEGSRGIEVKGRAGIGDVELTENEWPKACNQRGRYWLYVVFDCGTPHPRLLRVQDPFGKLVVHAKGGVRIDETAIFDAAEGD
jgi:superfamily II DNA or RNA helicase